MKALTSIAFGAFALAAATFGTAPAASADSLGVYAGPHGFGITVHDYDRRGSCRDRWYRERHWRYCHRGYDRYDNDYYYNDYYWSYRDGHRRHWNRDRWYDDRRRHRRHHDDDRRHRRHHDRW